MAKQEKIILSGKIRNLVFYVRNGVPCVRTIATNMKQTRATKRSAGEFGKAVQIAKALRQGLYPVLPDPKDRKMMHRLDNAILQWIRNGREKKASLRMIEEVELYEGYTLQQRLKFPFAINWNSTGNILIQIPSIDMRAQVVAPAHTTAIKLRIAVTGCKLKDYSNTGMHFVDLQWLYTGAMAAQSISLPFAIQQNTLTVVAARMIYIAEGKKGRREVQVKRWLPAGVIGTFYKKAD